MEAIMVINKKRNILKSSPRKKFDEGRVLNGLSLRGSDMMVRLRNGSLRASMTGQFSLDEQIDAGRRMTKLEAMNEHRKITEESAKLRDKLKPKNK